MTHEFAPLTCPHCGKPYFEPDVRKPAEEPGVQQGPDLPHFERKRICRTTIVQLAQDFLASRPDLSRRQADELFSTLYNNDKLPAPHGLKAVVKSLSRASIERWRSCLKAGRLDLLAGNYKPTTLSTELEGLLDGEVVIFMGAKIAMQPFVSAPHLQNLVAERFPSLAGKLPSARSFQRFIGRWKQDNREVLKKLDPGWEWGRSTSRNTEGG